LQAICDRLQPGTIEVFVQRWLPNLDQLQAKARAANRRILEAERARPGHRPREPSL
jgi:hypothetical protein